jgi:hypothetical protein
LVSLQEIVVRLRPYGGLTVPQTVLVFGLVVALTAVGQTSAVPVARDDPQEAG